MRAERAETARRLAGLWLPAAAWMAAIFFFSHQRNLPTPSNGLLDFVIKKTGHLIEYGLLGLLLLRACWGTWRPAQAGTGGSPAAGGYRLASAAAIVLGALYAASDEVHQAFVPTRTARMTDVLIDTAAIAAAVAVAHLWRRRSPPAPRR